MTKLTPVSKACKRQTQGIDPHPLPARCTVAIPSFDELPDSAFVRQSQLVRDPKHPTRPAPLPFSPATFWRKVRMGQFPASTKLGDRITCWNVGDVRRWLKQQAEKPTIIGSPVKRKAKTLALTEAK